MNMFVMLERLTSQPVVERLGWVLVHSLWQFALLAILAGVIVRRLRRNSASMRYGVLVVTMALSVAAPVATWLVQPVTSRSELAARPIAAAAEIKPEAESMHPAVVASPPEKSLLAPEGKPNKPTEEVAITPLISPPLPVLREEAPPPPWLERVQTIMRPWLVWIVAGWGLGVAFCSLRPLLGWHMLRRLRRAGISPATDEAQAAMRRVSKRLGLRRVVQIWHSTLTQVPIVVGYLRPVVLLPVSLATSLPISQLEAILAHELAHVRRHDFLVNLLQTLVETLFFYHPAVWWLSRQIRVEREHCCDDLVVALLGDRVEYGRALVAIEQIRGQRPLLALGVADGSLLARVRRILGRAADPISVRRRDRLPLALLGVAICGLALGLSLVWSITAKDADATETEVVKFSATLPNGATVELAGVGYHNWTRRDWWQASGVPLDAAPRDEALREVRLSECKADKQGDCREFAIRITGLPKRKELFGYQFTYGALTDAPARAVMYEPTDFRTAQFPAKPDVKTVTLRIGMDELPEEVLRSIGMEGKKIGPAPALVALRKADNAVQMVSAETLNGQTQLLLKEIPRGKGPLVDEGVPVAVDKDGKRHESIRAGGRPGFFAYLYPVPLDQIVRFEYRLRFYRHWVTFENVSLHAGEKTEVRVRVESMSEKRQLTAAEQAARNTEIDGLRAQGRAALVRGDYQEMAKTYGTLSKMADGPYGHLDAVSLGHSLHIVGKWKEAREAFQRAISLADQRLAELDQMTEPEVEESDDPRKEARTRGPGGWEHERDRERERIEADWPQLVLLAGQLELMLGEVESAVKTLSRGIRFAPLVESLENLSEAALAALKTPPDRPPTPHWHKLIYPIATQYHLALAFDKRGDSEGAARCWSRVHLSHLAYQVGMAEVDADQLVKAISQIPAAKRQPFHELVLKNPGTRRAPTPPAFNYQEPLKQDPRNPFQVLAKLEGFQLTKLGPPRSTLAKLPSGPWVMAFTGGDERQARIYLSSSADGKTWSPPWEFSHNNIFPTRNPSLIVDDDGLLWMLCTSQRFSTNPYSSGEYRLWLCSSRDGRDWSPLRPVKTSFEVSGQYQQTAQVTRDRTGKFWVISPQEIGSADSLDKLSELRPIKFPGDEKKRFVEDMHATFDERNRCHLVFTESGIYYSSSSNMVDWTPPLKLDDKKEGFYYPQTVMDGNRLLAIYQSGHGGWLRPGTIDGERVTWSERIQIGLPLDGSLAARDGDRLLLPSGRIGNGATPVLLVAQMAELLKLAKRDAQPGEATSEGESTLKGTVAMEPEVMVGEPAWIKFKVQNPTDKKLILVFNGDYRNRTTNPLNPKLPESFAVEMRGPDGKAIPPLAPNTMPNSVVRPWLELPAKGEGAIELFLPHWAKVTEPGKYGVKVRCQFERYVNDGPEWSRQKPEMLELVAEATLNIVLASDEKLGALVDRLGPKLLVRNSMEAVAEADRAHRMLSLVRHERAVDWYVKLLAQPGYTQMFHACHGLAPYGSDAAFAALQRAMKLTAKDLVSESPKQAEGLANNLRHAAAAALAANPHPEAADFLLAQSADRYDGVRLTVLHFAARIKTKKALEVIDQLTKDPAKSVREEALREQKELQGEANDGAKADIDPNGEIVGKLVDLATGRPVEGATIACGAVINDSGKGGGANTVTDAMGSYRLKVPSPGIYNVWVKKLDKEPAKVAAADDGILVEAGKVTTSALYLVAGVKVAGVVVDSGKPVAGLNVQCYSPARPNSGGVQSAKTKEDGTFEFFLPPGRAYVYVIESVKKTAENPFGLGRSAHVHIKAPAAGEAGLLTLALQKSEAKFGDNEWLNRSSPGTEIVRREGNQDVTGVVVDGGGKPISGAKVFKEDGPLVTTNDKGEFHVATLKGTQFVMHAFAPGNHLWFGTPTSGDVLKIVLEPKEPPRAVPGPGDRGAVDPPRKKTIDELVLEKLDAAGLKPAEGVVEKQVLDILRTPFVDDPKKGSWQGGAHEMTVLLGLADLRQQDRVVKTLLTVVDRSEKSSLDERRLAMLYLSGYASQRVLPLLIKELEQAVELPQKKFVPYHELAMLARMGELGEDAAAAMPILIRLLDYPDGLARGEAMEALVKIGPSSKEAMLALAERLEDPRAIYRVGRYGELAKPLGPKFVKLLDSKNKQTRIWAAQALVKSGFDEARGFDELMKDVAEGTAEHRGLAATALAALGSQAKELIPKLRAFENDRDERVAKEVRDAIRRIEKDDRIFTHAEESAKNAAARRAAAEAVANATAEKPLAEVAVEKGAVALPDIRLIGDEVSGAAITKLAGQELGILTLAEAKFSGEIIERLRHIKSIRALRLFGSGLSGQIPRLEHVKGLVGLEIGAPLTGRDLEAIGQLSQLEQLGLPQDMTINVNGAREIARLTKLKSLRLYNVNIDDASFAELHTLAHLEELDLTHTRITDAGLATIEKMPRIKTLELYRFPDWHTKQQLTDASLGSIARLTELERLSLSGKVSDAGLKQVARLPKLKSLMILGTEITGNGLGALEHSKVETLVLGADQLGPAPAGLEERDPTLEQFPALVNLKKCRALKHIMVNGKFLGEESKWWQRLLPDIGWGFSS